MENMKQAIELADIFRICGDDFRKTHNLCPDQLKAFDAITKCRTAALGGHTDQCDHCGHIKQSYIAGTGTVLNVCLPAKCNG